MSFMDRYLKHFIIAVLIGTSFLLAGFSSSVNSIEPNLETKFYSGGNPQRDTEFWDKFRDSVMPDKDSPREHHENEPPPNSNKGQGEPHH